MQPFPAVAPERAASILVVGRDVDGERLAQEGLGSVHGRFASFEEVLALALAERNRIFWRNRLHFLRARRASHGTSGDHDAL